MLHLVLLTILFRGLPIWLRENPNIIFRSDNQPFMVVSLPHQFQNFFTKSMNNLNAIYIYAVSHAKVHQNDHKEDEG